MQPKRKPPSCPKQGLAFTEEEMDTYDELMLIDGDSEVKKTLVMRKLSIMSNTNNARLRRHFR